MKKYAVFKSKTGYYYSRYAETLDDLKDTDFYGIIQEEQLPVIVDSRGSYFHFTGKEYAFTEIIESDEDPPLPLEMMYFKNDPDFKLGWMSPDGDTYSCNYTNHNKCAIALAKKFYPRSKYPESALDRGGWLKIIDSWDGIERQHGQFVYTDRGYITKKQADKLFDLGLYENEEVKKLIAASENEW